MEYEEVNTSEPQTKEKIPVIITIGFEFDEIVSSTTNDKQFESVETDGELEIMDSEGNSSKSGQHEWF